MAEVLYYILIVNTKLTKLISYHIVTHLYYITVEIELSITNIIIRSIYRHPSLKKDSYLCLNTCIEFFSLFQNKKIILCGIIDLLDDNTYT